MLNDGRPSDSAADALPPRSPVTRRRLARAALLWVIAAAVVVVLIRFDLPLMQRVGRPAGVGGHWAMDFARRSGEAYSLLLILPIVLWDRRAKVVVLHLLFAVYLAFNFSHGVKSLVARDRPSRGYLTDLKDLPWQTSWNGWDPTFTRPSKQSSFPSSHSAHAFAAAASLGCFYPRLRIALWLLAAACAGSRFFQNWHWASDCLAGALLGYLAAWCSLRVRALTRPRTWFRRD